MTSDDNRERRSVRLVGVVGVLILLASLAPRRVRAGDGVWTLTSEALWGLYVTQLVASPIFAADSTLFAATEEGIFRSADGARHWEPMNRGLAHLRVSSLAISPDYSNDRTLFAALADGGVYRSVDGGEHWTASWAGMVPPWNPDGQLVQVSGLGFSPSFADDNTLFASSWNDPIFKSVDGGATWTMLSSDAGPLSGQIEISPSYATDGTIFVTRALMADGIYKSTDGGATWERLMPTLPDQDLWQLAISPDYGADHTLFVRTERALFRSEDGGATWTHSSVGIVIDPDAALVFSPNYVVDRTMFVSTRHGVFASSDSGATWLPLHGGLDAYAGPILVVAPTRPLRLFAPLSYGLSGVWELTLTDPAPPPYEPPFVAVIPDDGTLVTPTGADTCEVDVQRVADRLSARYFGSFDFVNVFTNFQCTNWTPWALVQSGAPHISFIGDASPLLEGSTWRSAVGHEVAHRWLVFMPPTCTFGGYPLGTSCHWSRYFYPGLSTMKGGCGLEWRVNGDGTCSTVVVNDRGHRWGGPLGYAPLDLYLMGYLDPGKLPDMLVVGADADEGGCREGYTIPCIPTVVTIDDIIACSGQRPPEPLSTPTMATVLLTAQGTTPSAELIQALQSDIAGFVTDFHITTRGRARIDTSTPALKHTVFLSVIVTGSGPERQANPH